MVRAALLQGDSAYVFDRQTKVREFYHSLRAYQKIRQLDISMREVIPVHQGQRPEYLLRHRHASFRGHEVQPRRLPQGFHHAAQITLAQLQYKYRRKILEIRVLQMHEAVVVLEVLQRLLLAVRRLGDPGLVARDFLYRNLSVRLSVQCLPDLSLSSVAFERIFDVLVPHPKFSVVCQLHFLRCGNSYSRVFIRCYHGPLGWCHVTLCPVPDAAPPELLPLSGTPPRLVSLFIQPVERTCERGRYLTQRSPRSRLSL